jgi:hypothetical protein
LGDEEFFCLEGRFTFDGQVWFAPGSYVHFPPHFVHASHVEVPEGYLLYLRTTGDGRAYPVGPRDSVDPSFAEPLGSVSSATIVDTKASAASTQQGGHRIASPVQILRRADGPNPCRIELGILAAGENLCRECHEPIEVLLVSGALVDGSGNILTAPAYGYYPTGLGASHYAALETSNVLVHFGPWP